MIPRSKLRGESMLDYKRAFSTDFIPVSKSRVWYTSQSLQCIFLQSVPLFEAIQQGLKFSVYAPHDSLSFSEHPRILQQGIMAINARTPEKLRPLSLIILLISFNLSISFRENKCRFDSSLNGMIKPSSIYCLIEWAGNCESWDAIPRVYNGMLLSSSKLSLNTSCFSIYLFGFIINKLITNHFHLAKISIKLYFQYYWSHV